ncbi:hypothetical protein DFH09DRAFT_1079625 [Mycena vulgaris]|nr:hypothetical protein DFH09DRAFT_1079625 [Mycena vulgaris]
MPFRYIYRADARLESVGIVQPLSRIASKWNSEFMLIVVMPKSAGLCCALENEERTLSLQFDGGTDRGKLSFGVEMIREVSKWKEAEMKVHGGIRAKLKIIEERDLLQDLLQNF